MSREQAERLLKSIEESSRQVLVKPDINADEIKRQKQLDGKNDKQSTKKDW